MANQKKIRKENISGNFYVDSTCIDCSTCYWVAPSTFKRAGDMSAVYSQPQLEQGSELIAAYRALYSCPTNSIGVLERDSISSEVLCEFPYPIMENVYHTGFHSRDSFGAASYFIKSENGNILIDSPRYVQILSDKFNELDGISFQLLTHKDDVADTDKYWNEFKSKRFIHEDDRSPSTSHYEGFFKGSEPDQLTKDLLMIPVPGHTRGSVVFLYKDKYLFTGDHLAYSRNFNHLYAFKDACWYDFKKQIESMESLLDYSFEAILPGHGAPYFADKVTMKLNLEKCISWMKT